MCEQFANFNFLLAFLLAFKKELSELISDLKRNFADFDRSCVAGLGCFAYICGYRRADYRQCGCWAVPFFM